MSQTEPETINDKLDTITNKIQKSHSIISEKCDRLINIEKRTEGLPLLLDKNNRFIDRMESRFLKTDNEITDIKNKHTELYLKLEKIENWLIALENILKINSSNLKND